jgi:hypothetical protein
MSGIYHVEISRADNDRLRVEFTVGEFPDNISSALGRDPEGVRISVLVDTQANPRLLGVERDALERARVILREQLAAIDEAIRQNGS